jgi:hypothetical protein
MRLNGNDIFLILSHSKEWEREKSISLMLEGKI